MVDIQELFHAKLRQQGKLLVSTEDSDFQEQKQTNAVFTEKWLAKSTPDAQESFEQFQMRWYLKLYGFETEEALALYLQQKPLILDAGCGLGYKAAWFARLSPNSTVLGIDFSDAVTLAADRYGSIKNLQFVKGDIADCKIRNEVIDYISCDQVIMHTQSVAATFEEFKRVSKSGAEIACYFYAKKALSRELVDDHFRTVCVDMSNAELWALAEQVTELGRRLSALNAEIDCPDIPALGIKGGRVDVQRFVYWNFLKCFWNEELGFENSKMTNFDWYAPSNARRFSKEEVLQVVEHVGCVVKFFHEEPACFSGRFAVP
jgi:ubiquinone/menaquinone biosynthesis C-methylase UbiE